MPSQILSPKRKAIADSSRTMFMWVAGMSAVVGVCAVIAVFLGQQIEFKGRVLAEMTKTADTLVKNNKASTELTQNVRVLETNAALNSVKANQDEKALQVVLDSLPADRNALAFGASLQQNLLTGVDGLTIDSLSVDNGEAAASVTGANVDAQIPFDLQISSGDINAIKATLIRLEKSIRTIDIDTITIDRGDDKYQATIKGHVYYQLAKEVKLDSKTIPAKKGGR